MSLSVLQLLLASGVMVRGEYLTGKDLERIGCGVVEQSVSFFLKIIKNSQKLETCLPLSRPSGQNVRTKLLHRTLLCVDVNCLYATRSFATGVGVIWRLIPFSANAFS